MVKFIRYGNVWHLKRQNGIYRWYTSSITPTYSNKFNFRFPGTSHDQQLLCNRTWLAGKYPQKWRLAGKVIHKRGFPLHRFDYQRECGMVIRSSMGIQRSCAKNTCEQRVQTIPAIYPRFWPWHIIWKSGGSSSKSSTVLWIYRHVHVPIKRWYRPLGQARVPSRANLFTLYIPQRKVVHI